MIISKTPLRASLFGGGTDFADYFENSSLGYGAVLSAALDMHVYITVNKRFDDKIRIVYSGNELVDNIKDVKHNIIREAMRFTNVVKGVEIIYMADIPMTGAGIGLASSSALTVGVLNALHALKREFVTAEQLAKEACHIEIDCIGQEIGIQDQYATAYGGINKFTFNKYGSVSVTPVLCKQETIKKLSSHLMLFFTGNGRDSRQIFREQNATRFEKMNMLDKLVQTVDKTYAYIYNDNLDELGHELARTWEIKKKFASGVTTPEIDNMYDKAIVAGALGGKILGAGGGGFLLLYVPLDRQKNVLTALKDYRNVSVNFDWYGSRIIFTD